MRRSFGSVKSLNKKITFLIPCLNEAATIEKVVEVAYKSAKKIKLRDFEILVADDGSTDGSVEKIKKQGIARIIKVPIKGYGAALHWGILKAKGEFVLFADADLSYDFGESNKFIKQTDKAYDLILGSRIKGKIEKGAMPFLNRYLGTPVLTWLIRFMYGIKTSDCNSGMRAVRKNFYKELKMRNSGMEWASELLLRTAIKRGKYKEVKINFYKDKREKSPHLVPWADGWKHLKAIVLVKPDFLCFPVLTLFMVSILFYNRFLALFFFSVVSAFSLFLAMLAAMVLSHIIDGTYNIVSGILLKFPIVKMAIIITLGLVFLILATSDKFLIFKMFSVTLVLLFDIWVFLIETIKTYLVNVLVKTYGN